MGTLNKVVYLSEEQLELLIANGSIEVGGQTITFSNDDFYCTPDQNSSSSVESYSFEEIKTGATWVDGLPIYKKTFTGTWTETSAQIIGSVLNMDTIVNLESFVITSGGTWIPLSYYSQSSGGSVTYGFHRVSGYAIECRYTGTGSKTFYSTIWYTKSSDKNFVPKGSNLTQNGLTFSVQDDGSVIVTGTATATTFWGVQFTISLDTWPLAGQSFTLSGCPVGGGNNSYLVDVRDAVGGTEISGINADIGSSSTFTRSSALTAYLNIRIAEGQSGPLKFTPRISMTS